MTSPQGIGIAQKLGGINVDICLSGAAAGADTAWGLAAHCAGHEVVHWSYKGHRSGTKEHLYKLTEEELLESDEWILKANEFLKRLPNFRAGWINLLRRNWYQVKYSNSVYAVGTLNNNALVYSSSPGRTFTDTDCRVDYMGVNGGTAWACYMYFCRWMEECKTFKDDPGYEPWSGNPTKWFPPFKLIFYDQEKNRTLSWAPMGRYWIISDLIVQNKSRPCGVYTGIGTRDLSEFGAAWIKNLYNNT